jgi:hypothetical protein
MYANAGLVAVAFAENGNGIEKVTIQYGSGSEK